MKAGISFAQRLLHAFVTVAVVSVMLTASLREAAAQIGSDRYASIVVDAGSGNVLSSVNADEYRYPASLTKLMTIYMLFEALRDRRIALSQAVPVSPWAASMSPTKLGLLPGTYITVEQALLGLVTKSANDAAAALGEMMGGDEERFAQLMTLRARALGMTHTTFRNASGLPDWSQVTTARDMAILGRRLIQDFPSYYHYFSAPSFVFQGRTIQNHQRMLQSYPGADGLKTGYIGASGFNVVTSALRSDTRLVGVVLGGASGWERDVHMASLLDQGFDQVGVPTMMARYEPSTPYRIANFIGLAQAATIVSPAPSPQTHRTAAVRNRARGPTSRAIQAAATLDLPTARVRPAAADRANARNERLRARPVIAYLPGANSAATRRVGVPAQAAAPAPALRSKSTRPTKVAVAGRYRG